VKAHSYAWERKWTGNWRKECVASTLHAISEHGVSSIITANVRTPRLPAIDWTEAPADLNGLVRFVERRNLVSARVPSHFKRSIIWLRYARFSPEPYFAFSMSCSPVSRSKIQTLTFWRRLNIFSSIYRFNSYREVNTRRLSYKNRSTNAVLGNDRCLFCDP